MTEKITPDYLAKLNEHPRDKNIQFFEKDHKYLVNGMSDFTSTTTYIHKLFEPFDAEEIIYKMIKNGKTKDPKNKYYNLTKEEIKQQWSDKAKNSSEKGTNTHYNIECYYNKIPVIDDSIEFKYFMNYTCDFPNLKAYRTEWLIYDEELKISGSIDMVYENEDGSLIIADWKIVGEISYENSFGKYAIVPCISHIPDCNYYHYALQLNIYRKILERNYGKKVKKLYLVVLHENNTNYQIHDIQFLDKEIKDLFDWRLGKEQPKPKVKKNILFDALK
jgi:ATP-dependent exoDNAse (exonuclease V) beta subunit